MMSVRPGSRRVAWRAVAMTILAVCAAAPALAQLGEKAIRFVLPVGAGSGVDTITRAAAPALTKALGQPIVIENQPGAGGIVGTTTLVRATPDGATLSVISNNHVIYPSVYKSLPFDPINDVTPIAIIGTTPIVLVVNPAKISATNTKDLIALFKARPDQYNYASSGNGTILHLAAELFVDEAQVKVHHVPYKGVGPMVTDLIGGQVDMGMLALPSVQGHLKSGALRAIAVGGAQRVAAAPEIPTLAESGLPDYNAEGWFAVIGPAKMAPADVKRIHDAFTAAFDSPEVKDAMARQGNTIKISTPEFAASFMKSEMAKYARLVQKSGMKVE
jgi:tripartite-type tricarboxylate transporter receptor subunit TctC